MHRPSQRLFVGIGQTRFCDSRNEIILFLPVHSTICSMLHIDKVNRTIWMCYHLSHIVFNDKPKQKRSVYRCGVVWSCESECSYRERKQMKYLVVPVALSLPLSLTPSFLLYYSILVAKNHLIHVTHKRYARDTYRLSVHRSLFRYHAVADINVTKSTTTTASKPKKNLIFILVVRRRLIRFQIHRIVLYHRCCVDYVESANAAFPNFTTEKFFSVRSRGHMTKTLTRKCCHRSSGMHQWQIRKHQVTIRNCLFLVSMSSGLSTVDNVVHCALFRFDPCRLRWVSSCSLTLLATYTHNSIVLSNFRIRVHAHTQRQTRDPTTN